MTSGKPESPEGERRPARPVAVIAAAGLVATAAALWFTWTAKERSLEPRTRDRLR